MGKYRAGGKAIARNRGAIIPKERIIAAAAANLTRPENSFSAIRRSNEPREIEVSTPAQEQKARFEFDALFAKLNSAER